MNEILCELHKDSPVKLCEKCYDPDIAKLAKEHEYHDVEAGKQCSLCYLKLNLSIMETLNQLRNK